nr:tetratricopeptide repeat protein [Candidatus Sigynarchaeum springense]
MQSARDLLGHGRPLTFLVGAGCSIESPSNQPAGRAMMEALLTYFAPESEFSTLSALKELRFEALVEAIAEKVDKDMKIIDYYALCNIPNAQHFFLANQLENGQFVMTTNFDFLIEHAALQAGAKLDEFACAITRDDFTRHADPGKEFKQGKKILYKIHGSTMNPITKENTRPSLVATIQAFGSNKEGLDVFQLEPFKRPLFENITRGRSLVIMGYSGSDDFDIVPTLKVLKDIDVIIWIDHVQDDKDVETVQEYDPGAPPLPRTANKVDRILDEIVRTTNARHVYKIAANTGKLINGLGGQAIFASKEPFTIPPRSWFEQSIPAPSDVDKHRIAWKIYYDLERFPDARRCAQSILQLREQAGHANIMCQDLGNMAITCMRMNEYQVALEFALKALDIADKTGTEQSQYLNNVGEIYRHMGNYDDAIPYYKRTIEHATNEGDIRTRGNALHNIGLILSEQARLDESMDYLQKSLKISEDFGNLIDIMKSINTIGTILEKKRDYASAQVHYERALQIARELFRTEEIADAMQNLANIDYARGDVDLAIEKYNQALTIAKKGGNDRAIANVTGNLGVAWMAKKDYPKARAFLHEKLSIVEKINDLDGKANVLLNIGNLLVMEGKLEEAIGFLEQAIDLKTRLGDLIGKGKCLINFLSIYKAKNDTTAEFKTYDQLARVYVQARDQLKLAKTYHGHGNRRAELGDRNGAIELFQKALLVYEAIANHKGTGEVARAIAENQAILGSEENALEYYYKAIAAFSAANEMADKAECALNASELLRKAGRNERALEYLQNAIEAARLAKDVPIEANALQAITLVLYNLNKIEAALDASLQAEKLLENTADERNKGFQANISGVLNFKLKKFDEALAKYRKASELAPAFPPPVYNMACVHALVGNTEQSLDLLEKAVRMDSEYKEKAPDEPCFDSLKEKERFKAITKNG